MKAEIEGIKIILDEGEITDFWHIVMFALDLHAERQKEGKPCMTEDELRLANALTDLVDEFK